MTTAMDVTTKKRTDETHTPVVSRMPLFEVMDVFKVMLGFCDCSTRLTLCQVRAEIKGCVLEAIRKESRPLLAKLGIALLSDLPWIECKRTKVRFVVANTSSAQFILCVSHCCVLLFAKRGGYKVAVVHSDANRTSAIGWHSRAPVFSKQPIATAMALLPRVAVSTLWEATVNGAVESMAVSSDRIAIGTKSGSMALLNTHTGAVLSEELKGTHVAFADKQRVVGVVNEGRGKWTLREFTGNSLTKEMRLPFEVKSVSSVIASADGKRLYISVVSLRKGESHVMQYATDNWQLSASIALSGKPSFQCGIAASGLLAQGIIYSSACSWEPDEQFIDVIETGTRCVTQTIGTKHRMAIRQTAVSSDSSRIATVSLDGSVRVFDAISGQMLGEPRAEHGRAVLAICWLSTDRFVTAASNSSLIVWDFASQRSVGHFEDAHDSHIEFVLRLSNDSFATGARNGTVKKWLLEFE